MSTPSKKSSYNIMVVGIASLSIIIAVILALIVRSQSMEYECEKGFGVYNSQTKICTYPTKDGKPLQMTTDTLKYTTTDKLISVSGSTDLEGAKVANLTLASQGEAIVSATDPLQPAKSGYARIRYLLNMGKLSFALDIPSSQQAPTLYQGNNNVIYTMSGAPGFIAAVRGQLTAPEYIDRVVFKDLSLDEKKNCQIFETKSSSAGTTYYTIRGSACSKISEKIYNEGVFSVNDTRMP